jgi:EAL domain-containing protein (putative c-di-GMP-specific phosphodiesterase class I)
MEGRILSTTEQPRQLHSSGKFVFHREPARPRPLSTAGTMPSCFVVDREPGARRLIASVVDDLGLRAEQFDDIPQMLEAAAQRRPDLLFLDLGPDGSKSIALLGAVLLGCPVQIMSGLNAVLVEEIRRTGERRGLQMLPVLHKPFRDSAVRRIVSELGLRRDAMSTFNVTLAEALCCGWLEVWYQPKIDLRAKLLAGAEAYIRIRHPAHGVVSPDNFLIDAAVPELLSLTEHVIRTVLRDWPTFSGFGVSLKFAVNIPGSALRGLPLSAMLRQEQPKDPNWPGLILEVTEDDIISDLSLASDLARQLRPFNVGLAIDDFGAGYGALARLREVPFCELKIDRSYVAACDSDQMNAGLCETVIELAHRFGVLAVAEGIETAGELKALHRMDCDLGQGYLFARPLPKAQFAELLRQRGKARDR